MPSASYLEMSLDFIDEGEVPHYVRLLGAWNFSSVPY
jgi:hypothetical protein